MNKLIDLETRQDIVVTCPHMGEGGTQKVVMVLCQEWLKQGKKVTVISIYEKTEVYKLPDEIQHIHLYEHLPPAKFARLNAKARSYFPDADNNLVLLCVGRILKSLFRFKIKLQFFFNCFPPLSAKSQALRNIIRKCEAPIVLAFGATTNIITAAASQSLPVGLSVSERNDPAKQELAFPWNNLRKVYYNKAHIVSANSLGAFDSMRNYVDSSKFIYIPNPVLEPAKQSLKKLRQTKSGKAILTIGRLHPQKGQDVLLRAFAASGLSLEGWHLYIAGTGELDKFLDELSKSLQLENSVTFLGHVKDPFEYYGIADIFVLPSLYEGMPNVLLEAMSCSLPIITTKASSGIVDLIDHNENGLLVKTGDENELRNAILLLAENRTIRYKLGKKARETILQYNLPTIMLKWDELISRLESLSNNHIM